MAKMIIILSYVPIVSLILAFGPIVKTTGPTVSNATSFIFLVVVASINKLYVPAVRF